MDPTLYQPEERPGRRGWYARSYDPDTGVNSWVRLKGCTTLKQALKERDRLIREGMARRRSPAFSVALAEWEEIRLPAVAANTRIRFTTVFRRWREEWGKRPVHSITARSVERYHARLVERGLGPHTRNFERMVLRAFFDWCMAHKYAHENAARTLKRVVQTRQRPRRFLSAEEVESLLRACAEPYKIRCVGFRNVSGRAGGETTAERQAWMDTRTPPEWLHPLTLVAARTILRLGTLRALRWEYVDFANAVLRLPPSIMKTRDELVLPLAPDALSILRRLDEENRASPTPSLLVFQGVPGGRVASRVLARAARRAGIREKIGFHALRRSGATNLLRSGVPLKVVQQVGGWKRPDVLLECYQEVTQDDLRAAVDRLAKTPSTNKGKKRRRKG